MKRLLGWLLKSRLNILDVVSIFIVIWMIEYHNIDSILCFIFMLCMTFLSAVLEMLLIAINKD